jgi:hypothetical protein
MRLHVTVTDTGEHATFDGVNDDDAFRRFLGNCLATIAVSRRTEDGYDGPAVEIRWIPDEMSE